MNLRTIYQVYKTDIDETPCTRKPNKQKKIKNTAENLGVESTIANAQMNVVQSHYPANYTSKPATINTVNEDIEEDIAQEHKGLQPVEMKSIETDMNEVKLDTNRIIHPNAGLSGLYEFVPVSKIKGK